MLLLIYIISFIKSTYHVYVECFYWSTSTLMLVGAKGDTIIETILVLDGTNGSNMIKQVEIFGKELDVSSIIITKLDGTAKGGALISIANKYEIPISYVGLGEIPEDLSVFSAKNFARSILNLET